MLVLKFILGTLMGAALAVGFVRYEIQLPAWLQLPARLEGNLISTAIEADLFDLKRDEDSRRRALEIYFANRAEAAVAVDREAGHPFLRSLYRARASREARQLLARRSAVDQALAQPALKSALERKHGTSDEAAIKRATLAEGLDRLPFLKSWLESENQPLDPASLPGVLGKAASAASDACQAR
jgi:hypothetical protein